MKVIIAGSRSITNTELLKEIIEKSKFDISEVVCGDANGVDELGNQWAIENNLPVKHFPANWAKYGKAAGFIRNSEMAEYGDALIVLWDGFSSGTKMMIELAKKKSLSVFGFNTTTKQPI